MSAMAVINISPPHSIENIHKNESGLPSAASFNNSSDGQLLHGSIGNIHREKLTGRYLLTKLRLKPRGPVLSKRYVPPVTILLTHKFIIHGVANAQLYACSLSS